MRSLCTNLVFVAAAVLPCWPVRRALPRPPPCWPTGIWTMAPVTRRLLTGRGQHDVDSRR